MEEGAPVSVSSLPFVCVDFTFVFCVLSPIRVEIGQYWF